MSDPYDFPPPPSYELSQQGNDSKITPEDHFHHLTPSPKLPFHSGSPDSGDHQVKVTAGDGWNLHDKAETPQRDRKAATPRGARPRRPLPPRPADLQNQSTPTRAIFATDPDIKTSLPNYTRDALPSLASSPLNSPMNASFDTSTTRFDTPRRPYPVHEGHGARNYTFTPGFPRGNSHHTAPAQVSFDPSMAYGGSSDHMPSSSQKPGRVDPASLYASSVSSHVQTSSRAYQTRNPLCPSNAPFRLMDSSSMQSCAPSSLPHPSSHPVSTAPNAAGRRWAVNETDMTNYLYHT